jgi:hypothetical protein
MRDGYYAVYEIGRPGVMIYDLTGCNGIPYSCPRIKSAAALGPRYFAFATDCGVFCIDAITREMWSAG